MDKVVKKIGKEKIFCIRDSPSLCEGCGDRAVPPFHIYLKDGGTSWCLDCANAGGEIKEKVLDEIYAMQEKLNSEIARHYKAMKEIVENLK